MNNKLIVTGIVLAAFWFGLTLGRHDYELRETNEKSPQWRTSSKSNKDLDESGWNVKAGPSGRDLPAASPGQLSKFVAGATVTIEYALNRRRDGYCVLDTEIDTMRAAFDRQVASASNIAMSKRDFEYTDLLNALGVNGENAEKIKYNVSQVYKAKVLAGQALSQLMYIKESHDELAKKILGEKYGDYRAYEEAYPARREFEELSKLAKDMPHGFTPSEQREIENLIQKNRTFSWPVVAELSGPYQEDITPFGGKTFAPRMREMSDVFETRIQETLIQAQSLGLSSQALAILSKHFEVQLTSMRNLASDKGIRSLAKDVRKTEPRPRVGN